MKSEPTTEMLRVLRNIAGSRWGMCGSISTRRALVKRGLVHEIRDDQGRIHYEISDAGEAILRETKVVP